MTDNKNNNQVSDNDDDPTVELEPLSEEDCAKLAFAAGSSNASGLVVKRNEARRPGVVSESPTQGRSHAGDDGSMDDNALRSGVSSAPAAGLTEQREDYHELVGHLARLMATNAKIHEKLNEKDQELADSKIELEGLKSREHELLMELGEFRNCGGRHEAAAGRGLIAEEPQREKEIPSGAVAVPEEEPELALRESRQPQAAIGEAETASTACDGEVGSSRSATAISQESSRWILVSLDESSTETYRLSEGVVTVGSGPDNDIQIQSRFVSRHHAHFENTHKACVVGDLNSTNGTFVNSRRITKRMLRVGDVVAFGKHRFRYEERRDGLCGGEQIEHDSFEHSRNY